jgi:hypothetical protein
MELETVAAVNVNIGIEAFAESLNLEDNHEQNFSNYD